VVGQQAIINMPSADITPKGATFMMHETQWRQWNPGRYWLGTNFFAQGIGLNTELAVTSWNTGTPAAPNHAVGVGFKSAIPLATGVNEHKLTVGTMAVFNLAGQGMGNFTYSHYSFRLPKYRTRLTMGGWFATEELFKRTTGNILGGIEHPLSKKWILVAEYFKGQHDFGFVVPGILYHPTPRQIIVIGYKIATDPRNGKAGFVLEYGFFFGGRNNGGH
jgi:hypothetical protein